jgi:uncharacterized protein (TIGR02611 family)
MTTWTEFTAPPERRSRYKVLFPDTVKLIRRIVVLIAGLAFITVGVIVLPSPIPGILLILTGVVIWASEFLWARRLLVKLRRRLGIDRETSRKALYWWRHIPFWRNQGGRE